MQAGVISLQKLLIREKAGGNDTRSIYLISSNPDEPEMYELQCQTPREKKLWIDTIRYTPNFQSISIFSQNHS